EYPDGESQRAARRTLTFLSELEAYARIGLLSKLLSPWLVAPPEQDESHVCGWVPGAALLVRSEVFDQVGLLDEDLYTYFDDVDFCLRAKRAGWPTWYVPASRIVHLVGKTTGVTETANRPKRRPSYWFWARRHYFLKNFGPWHTTLADLAAIMGLCLWKLRLTVGNQPNPDPPHLLADLVRHSVFRTGYKIRPVENPALAESNQQATNLRTTVPTSTTS
ncbi:MAG: glycosyltransferase family 2 protein, partial [Bythopirellula sp.]